jgi:hypothetical protein
MHSYCQVLWSPYAITKTSTALNNMLHEALIYEYLRVVNQRRLNQPLLTCSMVIAASRLFLDPTYLPGEV